MTNQERIKALTELLAKNPDDSFSRYALALEYISLGETEDAMTELRNLIQRDPKYLAAYHQLGRLYCKVSNTAKAKEIYRQGIELAIETNDIHAKTEMEEELEEIEDEW
jgi:Tfp pilus assembly protein PilF